MSERTRNTSEFVEGGSSAVYTMVIVAFLYLINYMDRMVLSATLPLIKEDLMLTDALCGWLGTIYFIVVAILTVPAAILCDRWSRKKALSVMAVVWSIATFLSGVGAKFSHVFLARGGVGVGEAGFAPGGVAYVSGSFPEKNRSKVVGVFNLGAPLGTIAGLVIAGYVAEADLWGLGWRAPFYLFAVPGIILGILVLFTRDYPTDSRKTYRIDGQDRGVTGAILWMLRTPTLLFSYLGVAAMSFVGAALGHWLPTYFVRSRGIEVGAASLLMGGIIAASVFGPILGGAVADRWRQKKSTARPLTAGIIALLSGILIYVSFFIDIAGLNKVAYGIFIAVGVTLFAYAPPAYSISQDLVPRGLRSISMGTLVLVTYGTLAAYAPVVVGWLSDLFGAPGEPNLVMGFMVVPLVAFFGAFFFYMSHRYHDRDMKRFHS
ncbi:MAG: MFS transporter [Deltaproteobacteria bacterium]|nr:MFS transporter [Candidatus Zymogenaceae bacterium]